jgi:mannose-6-phosphate isomerase
VSPAAAPALATLLPWLMDQALPTWFEHGIDWARGGFHEKLDDEARPHEEPRRTRVVARQIYVFGAAQRLGWTGRSQDAIRHGLDFLLGKLRQPDALFASSVDVDGRVIDTRFDLYEQAFALFALAHAHTVCPDLRDALRGQAEATLDALHARYKHPLMGFEDSAPPTVPLKANPHMHMLEAALAWEAQVAAPSRWHALADELAGLALQRLINPVTGVLYEFFDGSWGPLPGKQGLVVEPGHQFEWGWLLDRWGRARGRDDALRTARRLIEVGLAHGICPHRRVAVNQLDEHFTVTDAQAKVWPQTEWVKAYHALHREAPADEGLHQALGALDRFLRHPRRGLWHEVMKADGRFEPQLCRASSFYHIVCVIDTLSQTP